MPFGTRQRDAIWDGSVVRQETVTWRPVADVSGDVVEWRPHRASSARSQLVPDDQPMDGWLQLTFSISDAFDRGDGVSQRLMVWVMASSEFWRLVACMDTRRTSRRRPSTRSRESISLAGRAAPRLAMARLAQRAIAAHLVVIPAGIVAGPPRDQA